MGNGGYGIAAIFANRAAFSRQKVLQSKDCGALQDGALRHSHQSAAHGGRKVAHMVLRFHMPPRCICFILLDVYRMSHVFGTPAADDES